MAHVHSPSLDSVEAGAPVEVTPEMIEAGAPLLLSFHRNRREYDAAETVAMIFRAMLSARRE